MGHWIALLAPTVTAASLVAYGVLRPAHEFFYGQLGVTPEEAGLSEVTMVGRSIIYAIIVVLFFVFVAGGLIFGYRFGAKIAKTRPALWLDTWTSNMLKNSRAFRIGFLAAGVLGLVLLVFLAIRKALRPGGLYADLDEIPMERWPQFGAFMIASLIMFFAIGTLVGFGEFFKAVPAWIRRIRWQPLACVVLVFVALWSLMGVMRFWDLSARAGKDIMAGKDVTQEF